MIRFFNHYVSNMAFILLVLELAMLLASALWFSDVRGTFRADNLCLSSLPSRW